MDEYLSDMQILRNLSMTNPDASSALASSCCSFGVVSSALSPEDSWAVSVVFSSPCDVCRGRGALTRIPPTFARNKGSSREEDQ